MRVLMREINCQQAIEVWFQQHIAKPTDPEAFIKMIADLVKQDQPS